MLAEKLYNLLILVGSSEFLLVYWFASQVGIPNLKLDDIYEYIKPKVSQVY
jgi:hypothetical protein